MTRILIHEDGDMSVGIPSTTHCIQLQGVWDDDPESLESLKNDLLNVFKQYSEFQVEAEVKDDLPFRVEFIHADKNHLDPRLERQYYAIHSRDGDYSMQISGGKETVVLKQINFQIVKKS